MPSFSLCVIIQVILSLLPFGCGLQFMPVVVDHYCSHFRLPLESVKLLECVSPSILLFLLNALWTAPISKCVALGLFERGLVDRRGMMVMLSATERRRAHTWHISKVPLVPSNE